MRPSLAFALAPILAPLLAGCCAMTGPNQCPDVSIPSAFSEKYVCPADRLTTRERPDLPYHRFVCPGAPGCEQPPPAELVGDPQRIALWHRFTYEERPGGTVDDHATVTLEVAGCGERRFYACSRTYRRSRWVVDCAGAGLIDLGAGERGAPPLTAPR